MTSPLRPATTSTAAIVHNDGIPPIKVVGIGGGGCNAVNRMIDAGIRGVDFIAVNTDAQQLSLTHAPTSITIGGTEARGLGVGGDPQRGARAAEESRDHLVEQFKGVDMVFIAAGMGGGTGTGAAPVVAEVAKRCGALTIAVVTRPFEFEGVKRAEAAQSGIDRLEEVADTVIVIPNQRLINPADTSLRLADAFHQADDVLRQGIQGISDVITVPGEINLDFNDVKKVMDGGGHALMALGRGSGENRATDAAEQAIRSPLLETSIDGATRVLYNVTSAGDLGLAELSAAAEVIRGMVHPEAEIIMGTAVDEDLQGDVQITVVATGFAPPEAAPPSDPFGAGTQPMQPAGQRQPAQHAAPDASMVTEHLLDGIDSPDAADLSTPAFLRRRSGEPARNAQPAQPSQPSHAPAAANGNGRHWDPRAIFGDDRS